MILDKTQNPKLIYKLKSILIKILVGLCFFKLDKQVLKFTFKRGEIKQENPGKF